MYEPSVIIILILFITNAGCESDRRILSTLKYSKNYVHPSVVNGVPAMRGEVPYLVSIKEALVKTSSDKYIWVNICGGSILSATKVLTAAHCFEYKNYFYYHNLNQLRLVAGNFMTQLIHTGDTDTTAECQWRKISSVKLHSEFYFPENDIALVFVSEPWHFADNVDFIVPARRRAEYSSNCISAGFGNVKHDGMTTSPILLTGTMFLMASQNCSRTWEMDMDKYICTYSFLSDASQGDSGGPLTCKGTLDPAERRGNGKGLLVGVVSGKNFDKTTLFTRVSEFHDWIERNGADALQLSVVAWHCILLCLSFIYKC